MSIAKKYQKWTPLTRGFGGGGDAHSGNPESRFLTTVGNREMRFSHPILRTSPEAACYETFLLLLGFLATVLDGFVFVLLERKTM